MPLFRDYTVTWMDDVSNIISEGTFEAESLAGALEATTGMLRDLGDTLSGATQCSIQLSSDH